MNIFTWSCNHIAPSFSNLHCCRKWRHRILLVILPTWSYEAFSHVLAGFVFVFYGHFGIWILVKSESFVIFIYRPHNIIGMVIRHRTFMRVAVETFRWYGLIFAAVFFFWNSWKWAISVVVWHLLLKKWHICNSKFLHLKWLIVGIFNNNTHIMNIFISLVSLTQIPLVDRIAYFGLGR